MKNTALKPAVARTLKKLITQYLDDDFESPDSYPELFSELDLEYLSGDWDLFLVWDAIGIYGSKKFLARPSVRKLYQIITLELFPQMKPPKKTKLAALA
jgi:hypothetical protein